ncbi:MAG: hypothetical protein HYY18_17775 [Planctomycetes bacterium]|nr:hypothetical protein [Planctomycetota bacterium]
MLQRIAWLLPPACALLVAGCISLPVYPVYLCPRCGPVSNAPQTPVKAEPGHALIASGDDGTEGIVPVCETCGEFAGTFSSEESDGFLVPVLVNCEAHDNLAAAVRAIGYPWDYTCPLCGKTAIRRPSGGAR